MTGVLAHIHRVSFHSHKKSVEKKNVASQVTVKYRTEPFCWTKELTKKDYGINKFFIHLADNVAVDKQ